MGHFQLASTTLLERERWMHLYRTRMSHIGDTHAPNLHAGEIADEALVFYDVFLHVLTGGSIDIERSIPCSKHPRVWDNLYVGSSAPIVSVIRRMQHARCISVSMVSSIPHIFFDIYLSHRCQHPSTPCFLDSHSRCHHMISIIMP